MQLRDFSSRGFGRGLGFDWGWGWGEGELRESSR